MKNHFNHFNSSLSQSAVQAWRDSKIVKAKLRLTISFTLANRSGGYHLNEWAKYPIIVRPRDVERVHDYAWEKYIVKKTEINLQNYLLVRVSKKLGFRTGEISTFDADYIDFETGFFDVLDSKRKKLYSLAMDMLTLQLIEDLLGERRSGLIFTHHTWKIKKAEEPLTDEGVYYIIHRLGLEAGVKNLKPRNFREYFAWRWVYVEQKDIFTLKLYLRHVSLDTTEVYVRKLRSEDDIRRVFDGVRNQPFVDNPETTRATANSNMALEQSSLPLETFAQKRAKRMPLEVAGESIYNDCSLLSICKIVEEYGSCLKNCRFKTIKKEI